MHGVCTECARSHRPNATASCSVHYPRFTDRSAQVYKTTPIHWSSETIAHRPTGYRCMVVYTTFGGIHRSGSMYHGRIRRRPGAQCRVVYPCVVTMHSALDSDWPPGFTSEWVPNVVLGYIIGSILYIVYLSHDAVHRNSHNSRSSCLAAKHNNYYMKNGPLMVPPHFIQGGHLSGINIHTRNYSNKACGK